MTKAAHIEQPFVFRPKIPEISSTIFIYRMEHPEPLIFPLGVRFPRDDEFPAAHEHQRDRIARARITTGYVLREQQDHSFQAFFEANVHAQTLWSTFHVLSDVLLPDVAAPIIGVKDDKPILGPYTDKAAAISALEPHAHHLQHDGFLEFGLTFQHRGRTEEIFVKSSKYLKIWTNHPDLVRETLERLHVPEVPDLQFIDEYPMVSSSLQTPEGNAGWPNIIEQVQLAFEALPRRKAP